MMTRKTFHLYLLSFLMGLGSALPSYAEFTGRQSSSFFFDAKKVGGFSRILKRGNQTIGQTLTGEQFELFIDGRGVLVDRNGFRISQIDPEIVRQAQEFFSLNRNDFQGNQRNAIDRFLLTSGGLSNGQLSIDLSAFTLREAEEGKSDLPAGVNRMKAGLAGLNFLLNTIQNRCLIRIFENQIDYNTGLLNIDLSVFSDSNGQPCFNLATLSLMKTADEKDRCNNGRTRINELIYRMMQPDAYNSAQGIDGLNSTQIAQIFGMAEDKLDSFGNKLLVGTNPETGEKESGVVGGPQRVLERQNTFNVPGRACYRSMDFKDRHEGGAANDSRSVEKSGILFSHEAEEWLCLGANGFLITFLVDGNGTLLGEAPGSIASTNSLLGPAVRNVASCLNCHANGFLGGGPGYTEQKQKIQPANIPISRRFAPNGKQLTHGDYFTTNAQYYAQSQIDSNLFLEAQKRSGSYLPNPDNAGKPFPIIPLSMHARDLPVTAEVMARELGILPSVAKTLLGGRQSIARTSFEADFCNYKAQASQVGKAIIDEARQKAKSATTHKNTPKK